MLPFLTPARLPALAAFTLLLLPAAALAGRRNVVTDPLTGELAGDFQFDWDGSRQSEASLRLGVEIEAGDWNRWARLSVDTYSGTGGRWAGQRDTYPSLELGHALLRDHPHRFYLNALLQTDAPSLLSSRGVDFSPQLGVVWGLSPDWWLGGEFGGTLATSPEYGYRRGYPSANLWLVWLPGGEVPDGDDGDDGESDDEDRDGTAGKSPASPGGPAPWDDSLTLNLWLAGSDDADAPSQAALSLEYRISLTDSVEWITGSTWGISGQDRSGVSLMTGLRWNF